MKSLTITTTVAITGTDVLAALEWGRRRKGELTREGVLELVAAYLAQPERTVVQVYDEVFWSALRRLFPDLVG